MPDATFNEVSSTFVNGEFSERVVTFTPSFQDHIALYKGIEEAGIYTEGDNTGCLWARWADGEVVNLGPVSSYYFAKLSGFTGSATDWAELVMATTGNATTASNAAISANNAKDTAVAAANSIHNVVTETKYANSTSGTQIPDIPESSWSTDPNPQASQYMWCRTSFNWGNNNITYIYCVSHIGADGTGAVNSVNGYSGVVTLHASDIAMSANDQTKIDTLLTAITTSQIDNLFNCSLTANIIPSGAGSVTFSKNPAQPNDVITVTATANTGYQFSDWDANIGTFANNTSSTTTYTVAASTTIDASFSATT